MNVSRRRVPHARAGVVKRRSRQGADPVSSAIQRDAEGILHALDIIRFEDAIDKPGPELHALNVLIPIAVDKAEDLRRAMEDMAKAEAPVRRVAYL